MKQHLKFGFTAILAFSCLYTSAQKQELTDLTKNGLIADYRLAVDILKKQHPNPYKFTDSVTLHHKMDSLLALASQQTNAFACHQFSPIRLFRDVHTSFRWSDDNAKEAFGNIRFFPFPVLIERDKLLVNIKGSDVPFGAEITRINKRTAKEVIQSMAGSSYSDGFITTGTDRVSPNFQFFLSLQNSDPKTYEIEYLVPHTNTVKKITVPCATPTEAFHSNRQSVLPINGLQRTYYVYNDYNDEAQTGVLTVNGFNLDESYAYKEFSAFFKEVNKRKYKNVIIDIRNNGGGNPGISALLYSFLSPAPFKNVYNYRTKTIKVSNAEYAIADQNRKMSEQDIQNNENFLYQRFDNDTLSGFYVGNARLKEGQLENFPPDKDTFKGNVYVLTGGGTVSAATYFASLVQKNKRGLVIGKETGSGEQATTAAWFLNYLLPNTKSILTVPMSELYFFDASKDNGIGVIPNKEVPIDQFISYMQASKDPELSYTMDLIKAAH
jgi:hypothetical protein